MRIDIPHRLLASRAPTDAPAPWLKRKSPRWQVAKDWTLYIDGRPEVVPEGYIFDGSSVPRLLWWLFPPGYTPAWEAACWHDYTYSHLHRRISKREADAQLRAIMLKQGASPFVAGLFHWAVKRFGRGGW